MSLMNKIEHETAPQTFLIGAHLHEQMILEM
jgi:hypothetical protein